MHRAYRPLKPAQNKLLQHRWDSDNYNEHRRKVVEARPSVDTRPPQTYMHLHLKLKKLQLEEERLSTIERDNRILLGKMSSIMKTKGRIDNQNNYEYKSLNREKRVRELLRVTRENQDILKRITSKQPQYDHTEWDRDWETNQQYMDQIAAYPKDWWKKQDEDPDKSPQSTRRETNRSSRKDADFRNNTAREENEDEEQGDYDEKRDKEKKKTEAKKSVVEKQEKRIKKTSAEEERVSDHNKDTEVRSRGTKGDQGTRKEKKGSIKIEETRNKREKEKISKAKHSKTERD